MLQTLSLIRSLTGVVLACLLSLGLGACGGGGGGGGSGGGGGLSFSADKSSLTFDVNPGLVTPPQSVTITASGTYSGTIYVAATVSGQGISPNIPITISGVTATAVVSADTSLSSGSYSGQLKLLACSDAACNQQIGNSPLVISFKVTVHPPLQTSPASITAVSASGTGATQAVTIQLPSGATSSSVTVTAGGAFVTISNALPSSFTVNLASLPSGTYAGSITVAAGGSGAVIPITYTVTPPAGGDVQMSTNPSSLTLSTVENGSTSATLAVMPPSWNPQVSTAPEYPAGAASGWLSATPISGGFRIDANATGLLAGSYTATLRVHGAYPSADILVPVALTVGPGLVRPADMTVTIDTESTAAAFAGSVPVTLAAGPAVSWIATTNAPWLSFSKGSGTTGQSLGYQIDPSQAAALANATQYPATITLTPASVTMTPVSFTLTLDKHLAEITSLAPYTQVTGQTARVVLRGTGFSRIINPAARLAIQGSSPASVSVINDTEIVARFSPLPRRQSRGEHLERARPRDVDSHRDGNHPDLTPVLGDAHRREHPRLGLRRGARGGLRREHGCQQHHAVHQWLVRCVVGDVGPVPFDG